jgi:hypothetical protein
MNTVRLEFLKNSKSIEEAADKMGAVIERYRQRNADLEAAINWLRNNVSRGHVRQPVLEYDPKYQKHYGSAEAAGTDDEWIKTGAG